ncbi:hypothetical protein [Nocardia sp. NPDC059691]
MDIGVAADIELIGGWVRTGILLSAPSGHDDTLLDHAAWAQRVITGPVS